MTNAAIFVDFIQLTTAEKENPLFDKDAVILGVLVLGWLTGLLLYWSSKGYYYWNINFIILVNYYEKSLMT